MPASGISLVDANVWLALAVKGHAHHSVAKAWFESLADDSCAFCRITQLALLRHLTNSRIMGAAVQTQAQAWQIYDALADDPRVVVLNEPHGVAAIFKALTQAAFPGHAQWTDAYLAAFAQAAGLEIVTFDAGLRRSPELKVRLLLS